MFSHNLKTSIEIAASPEAVWEALVDFDRYNDWNPMLQNMQAEG